MRRKRQAFTVEFKLEAVRLANESGRPISQVARELGIRPDVLGRWRRELDREPSGRTANGAAVGSPEEEIRRLQRELAILREEREILKKATHTAASRALFEFIEIWYNRRRRHSSLGYRSPAEFEHALQQAN